jgi:hypothetical protein
MPAYQITHDGLGFSENINKKFFWKETDADRFCQMMLHNTIVNLMTRLMKTIDIAKLTFQFRDSIKKDNAITSVQDVLNQANELSLIEIADRLLSIESGIRILIPYKHHKLHSVYKHQVNDLLWLCVSIHKQFKSPKI